MQHNWHCKNGSSGNRITAVYYCLNCHIEVDFKDYDVQFYRPNSKGPYYIFGKPGSFSKVSSIEVGQHCNSETLMQNLLQ